MLIFLISGIIYILLSWTVGRYLTDLGVAKTPQIILISLLTFLLCIPFHYFLDDSPQKAENSSSNVDSSKALKDLKDVLIVE